MNPALEDFELVKKANFMPEAELVANAAIASLHYLKSLSIKLSIPIEKIMAEHIISELRNRPLGLGLLN